MIECNITGASVDVKHMLYLKKEDCIIGHSVLLCIVFFIHTIKHIGIAGCGTGIFLIVMRLYSASFFRLLLASRGVRESRGRNLQYCYCPLSLILWQHIFTAWKIACALISVLAVFVHTGIETKCFDRMTLILEI